MKKSVLLMFCMGCALSLYAQAVCDAEAGSLMPSATFSAVHCGKGANEPLLLSNNSTNANYQSIFILTNADSIVQKINPYMDSQFDLDNFPAGEYRIFSLNLPIANISSLNQWVASFAPIDIANIQTWLSNQAICSEWCDEAISFWRYEPIMPNSILNCNRDFYPYVSVSLAPSGGLPEINDTAKYHLEGQMSGTIGYGDTATALFEILSTYNILISDDNGCRYFYDAILRENTSGRKYCDCSPYMNPLVTERFCNEHIIGSISNIMVTEANEIVNYAIDIDNYLFSTPISATPYFDLDTLSIGNGTHYLNAFKGWDNNHDGKIDSLLCDNPSGYNAVSFQYYGNYVPTIDWLSISDSTFQLRVSATGGSGEYEVRGNVWNDWQLERGDTLLSSVFEQGRYCYVEIIDRVYGCSLVLDSTTVEQNWEVIANGIGVPITRSTQNYHIYPNPVSDRLFIQQEQTQNTFLEVYNMYGCLLQTWQFSESKESISIANYPNGLYFVRLRNAAGFEEMMPFMITR